MSSYIEGSIALDAIPIGAFSASGSSASGRLGFFGLDPPFAGVARGLAPDGSAALAFFFSLSFSRSGATWPAGGVGRFAGITSPGGGVGRFGGGADGGAPEREERTGGASTIRGRSSPNARSRAIVGASIEAESSISGRVPRPGAGTPKGTESVPGMVVSSLDVPS
jgi:hypothetical protein